MRLILKIAFVILAVTIALLLIAVAFSKTEYAKKVMGVVASQTFSIATGTPVEIEEVSFAFPYTFKVAKVMIGEVDNPQLTIRNADLTLEPFQLLKGKLVLKEINLCHLSLQSNLIRILKLPSEFNTQSFHLKGACRIELNESLEAHSSLTLTEENTQDSKVKLILHFKDDNLLADLDLADCKQGLLYSAFHLENDCDIRLKVQVSAPLKTWMHLMENKKVGHNQGSLKGNFALGYGNLIETKGLFAMTEAYLMQVSELEASSGPLNLKGDLYLTPGLMIDGSSLQLTSKDFSYLKEKIHKNAKGHVTANIDLFGHLNTPKANIELLSQELVVNEVPLEPIKADGFFSFDKRFIKLKNFLIKGQESEINGSIEVDLLDNKLIGNVNGSCNNIAFLESFTPYQLNGQGKFSAIFSKGITQIVEFKCELPIIAVDEVLIEGLQLTSRLLDPFDEPSGLVHVALAKATWGDRRIDNFIGDSAIDITKPLWPFSCAFHGKMHKSFNLNLDGKWHAGENSFHLALDRCDGKAAKIPFSLNKHLSMKIEPDLVDVTPVELKVGEGLLQGSISYSPLYTKTNLYAERIPFSLLQLVLSSNPCTGLFSGSVALEGPPDELIGKIAVGVNDFKISKAKLSPLQGSLQATLTTEGLNCRGNIRVPNQAGMQLEAKLPLSVSLSPFAIKLEKDAPISSHVSASLEVAALMELLMNETSSMEGKMNMAVNVTGSLSHPNVSGKGDLVNGSYESHDFGAIFQNINAGFEGDRDKILLKQLTASDSRGGTITGNGTLFLNSVKEYPFDIAFALKNAALLNLDYVNGSVNGELNLKGNFNTATLKGEITANPLNIVIPEKIPEIMQTIEITYINQPKDEPAPQTYRSAMAKWPIQLDVDLKVPNNGSITGRDLTSQWAGEFKVKGTTDHPLFYGEYKIVKGKYLFNGKDFEISEGTIKLAGDLEKKTTTYVIASKDLDEVKVEVILRGPIHKPIITFRSNPPLPQREILSWILFNRGSSEITAFQGSQLNESITNLGNKQEGPDFLTKIRTTFGIDRIDFGNCKDEDSDQMSFQVGKYISQNVYVSVNKSDINRLSVEASLRKNVKLQAEVGDDAEGQILLKWKQDY